ncbi:MAG TPA: hypothetical protein VNE82_08430 [Candidatus Binataceae bacterium]|nr:hypothetical protein [Candidatus Binataceae bacterium]
MLQTALFDAPQVWIKLPLYCAFPQTLPYCEFVQSLADPQVRTQEVLGDGSCEYPVGQLVLMSHVSGRQDPPTQVPATEVQSASEAQAPGHSPLEGHAEPSGQYESFVEL